MTNIVSVKCLGVINDVKVKACGIEVVVDTYVMLSKGDDYPIILRRPSLMAMQATKNLDPKLLEMKTSNKGSAKPRRVVFNIKKGCQD